MLLSGKRGPPHAICADESKPRTPEDYDRIVCAEIADKQQFSELYKTVTTLNDAWSMWVY